MAAEYSRELGVKVLEGQKRLARLGFKQGGVPGYGLRRMLVSADGDAKQLLANGERKSIATDRVILVPGPREEVKIVRDIYCMLISENRTVYTIACELNRKGIKYIGDSKWDYLAVYSVLTHPKYAGCHVFGRTSSKLCTPVVRLSRSEWTLRPGAFMPLVDQAAFDEAQRILRGRTQAMRENLIAQIQAIFPNQISIVRRGGRWRSRLRLRNRGISVLISRPFRPWKTTTRWLVDPIRNERNFVTLLARLNVSKDAFQDFHILPNI